MSEKKQILIGLPTSVELVRPSRYKRTKVLVVGLCLGALGAGGFILRTIGPTLAAPKSLVQVATAKCPQTKPVTPIKHSAIWESIVEKSATDEHRARTIEWLSGAVRIRYVFIILCVETSFNVTFRTESYDHMEPVGVDPRWDVFGPFHDYLLQAFPLVYVPLRVQAKLLTGLQPFHFVFDQS